MRIAARPNIEPRDMPKTVLLGRVELLEPVAWTEEEVGVAVTAVLMLLLVDIVADVPVGVAEWDDEEGWANTVWSTNRLVAFSHLFSNVLKIQRITSLLPPAKTTSPSDPVATE